jgi:hypothetical protein
MVCLSCASTPLPNLLLKLLVAYTVGADDPEILIVKLDQHIAPINGEDPREVKDTLEIFARYTQTNGI